MNTNAGLAHIMQPANVIHGASMEKVLSCEKMLPRQKQSMQFRWYVGNGKELVVVHCMIDTNALIAIVHLNGSVLGIIIGEYHLQIFALIAVLICEVKRMIDEKKLINYIKAEINPYGRPFEGTVFEFGCKVMEHIEKMDKVGEWIPFKLREADEEETEAYGLAEMLCGELPKDGEEILVTYDNGYVGIDTFIWDGCECYLDSNREFCTEAIAWQRKPAPYDMRKKVEE